MTWNISIDGYKKNMKEHPRLLAWWKDNPSDPDRPRLDNPDIQRLISQIAPGSKACDLGGTMSLNVLLEPAGVVLRVHQPFVTHRRLLAIQQVRQYLANQGFIVPIALPWYNAPVFRCGKRWAELENYLPHNRAATNYDSYYWLFRQIGRLHRALASLDVNVPRPLVATYAPPGTLRRWLPVTEAAVQSDEMAVEVAHLLHDLVSRLSRQWLPASQLPQQLIHGDIRLSNVCLTPEGKTVYLDFGFLAYRPRIHELAYSLAFTFLALHGNQSPESFAWQTIPQLIQEYEAAANSRLTSLERKALAPYTAAVPLYAATLAGLGNDPTKLLRDRLPFLRLSEWLLAHPEAVSG
jgi:Ser/Thr protein kinase RdoA (MazF antagonist)